MCGTARVLLMVPSHTYGDVWGFRTFRPVVPSQDHHPSMARGHFIRDVQLVDTLLAPQALVKQRLLHRRRRHHRVCGRNRVVFPGHKLYLRQSSPIDRANLCQRHVKPHPARERAKLGILGRQRVTFFLGLPRLPPLPAAANRARGGILSGGGWTTGHGRSAERVLLRSQELGRRRS